MKLVLFFSRGISLSIWHNSGLLERELATYRLQKAKIDTISLLTYGTKDDISLKTELKGFEILNNPLGLPTDLFGLLAPFIYRHQIRAATILKTNQINGWWVAGLAKLLFKKPLVVRCGYLLSLDQKRKQYVRIRINLVSLLEKIAFRYADAVIVTTPRMRDKIIGKYSLPAQKVNVIPNSINTDVFCPLPDISMVPYRLGFVGRFSPEKNLPLLLEAVSAIKGVSLLLIGDGVQRQEIEFMALQLGVPVKFCGNVPNYQLPELLNSCHAFVLPSKWEGMPKALLEAMSCGLPVIGTDVPGIRDLIVHDQNGYLCPNSIKGLREGINSVLYDRALCERLGKKAREYILQNFTIELTVAKELILLQSLSKQ
jgi:glycosyltransferase involved in cell wall biosynthesis